MIYQMKSTEFGEFCWFLFWKFKIWSNFSENSNFGQPKSTEIPEFRPFRSGPVKNQNQNPNPWMRVANPNSHRYHLRPFLVPHASFNRTTREPKCVGVPPTPPRLILSAQHIYNKICIYNYNQYKVNFYILSFWTFQFLSSHSITPEI
jgi:hypothetical protein